MTFRDVRDAENPERSTEMKNNAFVAVVLAAAVAAAMASTASAQSARKAEPLRVLLVGNSQCPTIVGQRLLENLAASDSGSDGTARPIEVGGCIKGGTSLKSHWELGDGPTTARGMIAAGGWDFVVLQRHLQRAGTGVSAVRPAVPCGGQGGGRQDSAVRHRVDPERLSARLQRQHRMHLAMGRELDVPIVDASQAYIKYFGDQHSTERLESLFAKDRIHPGLWGSYMYSVRSLRGDDRPQSDRPGGARVDTGRRRRHVARNRLSEAPGDNRRMKK